MGGGHQESSEFPVNHAIAPLLAATSVSVKQHGIHSPGRLQVDRHPTAHAATPRAFESDAAEVWVGLGAQRYESLIASR